MKKNLLLVAFIFIFIGIKAQVTRYEFPSGGLTEETISNILENSRKNGVKEWEIEKLDAALHARLVKQKQAIADGTFGQKTIQPPLQVNSTSCVNPGFELNNTTGWTFFNGDINLVPLPCNTCPTTAGAINNIVTAGSNVTNQCISGNDKYGGFPVVAPAPTGGSYSLLLNDVSAGGKIEQAQYSFVVNNTNDFFTFQYAAVLQSGGNSHTPAQQPYFNVSVTDVTTGTVVPCTSYEQNAPATGNIAGWSLSSVASTNGYGADVYTKSWTTAALDLSSLVSHTVNVVFTVSDCNQGGHFGYCYLDADCGSLFSAANVTGICGTAGNITLNGPPGYASYQWYGPNPPYNIIPGATSSTYTLGSAPSVDTFEVKATFTTGCVSSFKIVVQPELNISAYSTSTCRGNTAGTATVSAGTGNFSYVWTGPTGSIGTFTTTSQSNLAPGTYSVQVVDNTSKCPTKDTTITVLAVNPTLQKDSVQFCGTSTVLNAPNAFTATPYQWYNNTNTLTAITTQTNSINGNLNGQHYTVTYIDATTHCEDSLQISLNQTVITFTAQATPPCGGGNNGAYTYINTSSNSLYPFYNWAVTGSTTNSGTVSATSPINISGLSNGTYTMVISAPGNPTCADTLKTVLSNTTVIVPTVVSVPPNCNMDTVKIVPATPNVTHSWSGTAAGSTVTYPYTATTLTVYPSFTNAGTGYYNYTDSMRTIPDGCLSIVKYVLSLKSFTGNLTPIEKLQCYHDTLGKIKASVLHEVNGPLSTPDVYTFNWSPSSLTTTTATGSPCSSSKAPLAAGIYTCTISNGNCVNTYTYNMVSPAPLPTDSFYAYYCPKDDSALLVANITGNTNYAWHYYGSTGSAHINQDSIKVPVPDINKVYVTYKHNGCADTAKFIVPVTTFNAFRPNETVNIFTPNNDGRNDFFYPFYQSTVSQSQIAKQAQDYTLKIYNRWGILLYETTDYTKPWDGKTKGGADVDAGSYFYVVTYQSNCSSKADLVEKKGFVELMR